jgi:hypothetical protein
LTALLVRATLVDMQRDGPVGCEPRAALGGLRLAVLLLAGAFPVCGHDQTRSMPNYTPVEGTVVAVVGDIAQAGRTSFGRQTAALIAGHSPPASAVLLAGDNARYGTGVSGIGLLEYYQTYWASPAQANWGQFDAISFPQSGNHEYGEPGARGYFDYFAPRFAAIDSLPDTHGQPGVTGAGWYSFDLDGWHVVSLNSQCDAVGGCGVGSPQERWLASDLADHAGRPLIAVWHVPRHACGGHPGAVEMQAIWADLVAAGADLVFNGHDHYYQRWRPLDASASVDPQNGVTELIVGSGGVTPTSVCWPADSRIAAQLGGAPGIGVLFLALAPDGRYSFEYRLAGDGSLFDAGSGVSHHAPRPAR